VKRFSGKKHDKTEPNGAVAKDKDYDNGSE
jgi:hypothetical protein